MEVAVSGPVQLSRLMSFDGVSKHRSMARAMRRGLVTLFGTSAPKRPFNNRSRKSGSREQQVEKERFYNEIKGGTYQQL